ncbi:hypothetical protein SmJEL517_g06274 [Synchytrium microbalum]|uniref:Mitochondrial import inner membrane translocase subunit Tim21 n=1 Tax=Synchytrium microbalum TaxID=1806994 RepID=A0A507BXI5_9FUNG|nr:uncharacterized protein SmJEL517_g06274 [Synchytrium microbalum]TPX30065.1 hypothetical protein SmJEL517_g06274 [Synchytrium microbalum]
MLHHCRTVYRVTGTKITSCSRMPTRSRYRHFTNNSSQNQKTIDIDATTGASSIPHSGEKADAKKKPKKMSMKELVNTDGLEWKKMTSGQRVVHSAKTVSYTGVIIFGVVLFSTIMFFLGSELFGSTSASSVFSDALDKIHDSEAVKDLVGDSIKGHGDHSGSRARRSRGINHTITDATATSPRKMYVRFYIEGTKSQGTVHCNMYEDPETGKWEYKTLRVDVPGQGLPSTRLYVVDNRVKTKPKEKKGLFKSLWKSKRQQPQQIESEMDD